MLAFALPLAPGCSNGASTDGVPRCLDQPANLSCQPLYGEVLPDGGIGAVPFSEVYSRTLIGRCATGGGSCHGPQSEGRNGGLVFDSEDSSHQALLENGTSGHPRVTPGNIQCGELIVRLETERESWSMPRGGHLDEAELCSIRHWIANGAPR